MWFDSILIDRVFLTGELESYHIRAADRSRLPIDRLEDIDPEYKQENTFDAGPVRIYERSNVHVSKIKSKIKNIACDGADLYIQLDHFGIPLSAGYYACVYPKGWRLVEAHLYDPYSNKENPAENRSYRDIIYLWDPESQFSSAQLEMLSNRGTFSLGLISRLQKAESGGSFIERERSLSVIFSDDRHKTHPLIEDYRESSGQVLDTVKRIPDAVKKIPAINLGLSGPSIDIIAWGRYLKNRIRRPKC